MKNSPDNMDIILRNALRSEETPDTELIRKVKNCNLTKEETVLKKSTVKRSFSMAAIVAAALIILTTTAFAAWHFLNPGEVAGELFDNGTLKAAFEGEGAVNINESVTSGGYKFTLLGIVSGKDISDNPVYIDGEIHDERTYSVIAIQKADGSPMPSTADEEYGNPSFYVSPYVKGQKPWMVNAHTLHGGYSETVVDGVMYRLLDCDEIAIFAEMGVYIGINTGAFYDSKAFIFDEETGELKADANYDGANAVFELPLDKNLADSEKARRYLDTMFD